MSTVLFLTRDIAHFDQLKDTMSRFEGGNSFLWVHCASAGDGLQTLNTLQDPFVWIAHAGEPETDAIPAEHPRILLDTGSSGRGSKPGPLLELPVRPMELLSWIHYLHAGVNKTASSPEHAAGVSQEELDRVTHDLNNRLTTVSGYVSLLPDLLKDEEEMIREIEKALRAAESLIDSLQSD